MELGVIKNFVASIDWEVSGFAFLRKTSRISKEKLKVGIFDSPQIRELMKYPMFNETYSEDELSAWQSQKSVVTNFLGNLRSVEYEKEIAELLKSFCQLGACE